MKNFLILCSLLFLLAISSCGSNVNTFAKYISAERLKQHLTIIASDSMDGREMATDGERKASNYISKQFKDFGLTPSPKLGGYLQGFEVVKDSIEEAMLWVGTNKFSLKKYGRIEPKLNDNADFITDTIVFVGYGIDSGMYNDYKNIDVRGKTILICEGEPKTDSTHYSITGTDKKSAWSRYSTEGEKKLMAAKAHGAKGVFVYNETLDTISEAYARYVVGGFHPPDKMENSKGSNYIVIGNPILKALVGEKKGSELFSALHNREQLGVSFIINKPIQYIFKKSTSHKTVNNVIGYVEGTDKKDEFVIVSAHYDHLGNHGGEIYHGADDNGSGTCGLLGIAEAFSKAAASGKRPRRSVIFLSVTGEEKGLFGSKNYVAHPAFPLEQTVVDINTDMIGRTDFDHDGKDSNYIYVIGDEKISSELRGIDERNNKEHTKLDLDYKYNDPNDPNRFYYRSDHYEFAQKHIPIIFYFDGVHKDYHKPTDTVNKINFEIMEKRARLAYYTAWEIANREERLKADKSGE